MATDGQQFRMPRELERAGALCLAFANTEVPRFKGADDGPALRLDDYAELVGWGQRMGILGAGAGERLVRDAAERPQDAAAVLASGREQRSVQMRIFTELAFGREPAARDLEIVNGAVPEQKVVPGPDPLTFRREPVGDPVALDRVFATVAHSAAELLTSDKLDRLRQCGAEDCWRLFLHRSSRRLWCDMNLCGNRLKSARYHRRHRR